MYLRFVMGCHTPHANSELYREQLAVGISISTCEVFVNLSIYFFVDIGYLIADLFVFPLSNNTGTHAYLFHK